MMDPVFLVTALVAVSSALVMVTRKNPVYAAAWLLITFLSMAVAFLTLSATFLAAIHVLVYTGAILVLFVFVIMLLNLKHDEFGEEYPLSTRLGAAGLAALVFGLLAVPALRDPALQTPLPTPSAEFGSIEQVGMLLFTSYALPFEVVSLLIVVAMFGAMILAKKRMPT
jgi:NADH-quinone oxidoreductase subunit J